MNLLTLRITFGVLGALTKDRHSLALASGFSLGYAIGLTPVFTLHWPCFVLLTLFLRVNLASSLAGCLIGLISWMALSDFFQTLGLKALTGVPVLTDFWAALSHLPLIPYTQLTHAHVMGSFVFLFITAPILFAISYYGLRRYGSDLYEAFRATRLSRAYAYYKKFLR
jgi:uncharacterized protein (TIGR03546 family)